MSDAMDDQREEAPGGGSFPERVLVTGATGFVGRAVVRELVTKGHVAVCLVRDGEKFKAQTVVLDPNRVESVVGDLSAIETLNDAASSAEAAIHLVGIIAERPLRRQTFGRIHVDGTRAVVDACERNGIRRYVHMSALGARPGAVSRYHQTKWAGERIVQESDLDWTIFRPSVIHGPDAEFMELMRKLECDLLPPVVPYFGDGQHHLQPVSVRDVAHCFVAALSQPSTIGQAFELGGPEAITWKELYRICREKLPQARMWKPVIGQPAPLAKFLARTVMRLPILPRSMRFNVDQVQMSQEESVCETQPAEKAFGIKMRDFRKEFGQYAGQIK